MRPTMRPCTVLFVCLILFSSTAYPDDKKKPNEACTDDSECKGHCYTKKSDGTKVCVDCDPNTIEETRREISKFKETPKPCPTCQQDEVSEDIYKTSIEAYKSGIEWRKKENEKCWDGGNQGHKDAVEQAENAKRNCEDALSACKDKGLTFTCSESTYNSKNADTQTNCTDDMDRLCDGWSKDATKVDCRAIEEMRSKADRCKSVIDSLKSTCLDRLSERRQRQRDKADKGYYYCNDLVQYKQSNSACK
jgi:hypothetical protein